MIHRLFLKTQDALWSNFMVVFGQPADFFYAFVDSIIKTYSLQLLDERKCVAVRELD